MANTRDGTAVGPDGDNRSGEETREEIRSPGSQADDNLGDLSDALSPKADVKSKAASLATSRTSSFAALVLRNPGPALLVGVGAAWALLSLVDAKDLILGGKPSNDTDPRDTSESDKEDVSASKTSAAGDSKGADTRGAVRESATEFGDAMSERSSDQIESWRSDAASAGRRLRRRAVTGYEEASDRLGRAKDENPLLLGGALLAAGILVGIALPRGRRKKHGCMGRRASEPIINRAGKMAEEDRHKGSQVAAGEKPSTEGGLETSQFEPKAPEIDSSAGTFKSVFEK